MNKKIAKNYFYNLSYQVLMVIVPLITTPYVSRVLQASGVGLFGYTQTIAVAFSLFAALGINNYGQREIAYYQDDRQERSRIFWELFIVRLITTSIVALIYIIFSLSYKDYTRYLIGQGLIVVGTILDISWLFGGMEDFRTIAIRNIFVRSATVILIFILVKSRNDVLIYILINSISTILSYALFFVQLKKYVDWVELGKLRIFRHIKGSIEFFIPLIATQLYSHLDKIMLGAMIDSKVESGYYEQARKIVNIVILVLTSINAVMYPRISKLYKEGASNEIKNDYMITFRIIVMLMLPITVGLFVIAPDFTLWFFGQGYDGVPVLIRLSCLLLVFMAVGNFVGVQYLSPMGKQNKMTIIYIISAVINLILNAVLIPYCYSTGAMIASIIAEAFSCFSQVYLFKKSEYSITLLYGTWKYFVATFIMAAIITVFHIHCRHLTTTLLLMIEMILGMVVYFAVLLISEDEMIQAGLTKVLHRIRKDR